MRYTIVPLALSLGASAAITKRGDCPLQFIAKGEAQGTLGQLSDGQIRIGGGYRPSHFKIHDGIMKDHKGRGCIETEPEKQVQCDYGSEGDETYSINKEHRLEFDDSCNFWACPVNDDDEWNVYTHPLDGQDKCVPIEIHVYHEEPKHHHHEEPEHHDHEEPKHHHHEEPEHNDHDDHDEPKHHHHEEPEHNDHDDHDEPKHHNQEEPEHHDHDEPKHHHHEEPEHDDYEEPEHHRPEKPEHHRPKKPEHHHPEPPRTSPIPPCPGKECEKHHQEHCPGQYKCEEPDHCECHKHSSPSNCNSCKEHDRGCYKTCTVTKTEHKTNTRFATKTKTKTKHTTATATAYRYCETKCHGDHDCLSTCTVTKTKTQTQTQTQTQAQTQTKTKCHAGPCVAKPTPNCERPHGCSKAPPKGPSKGSYDSGTENGEDNYDNYNPNWRALTLDEASKQKRDISERLTQLQTNEKYRQEQRGKYDDCARSCHGSEDEREYCHNSCATDRCNETCGPNKPCFDQCYPYYSHDPAWCPESREKPCPKDRDCKKCGFGNYPKYYPGSHDGYGDRGDRDHRPFGGE